MLIYTPDLITILIETYIGGRTDLLPANYGRAKLMFNKFIVQFWESAEE